MEVLYGIEGNYKDVTNICLTLVKDGFLKIPSSDILRAKILGDPLPNILKHIKIGNSIYSDKEEIFISYKIKYNIFIWPNDIAYFVFKDVAKVFQETLINLGFDVTMENKYFHNDRMHIIIGANEIVRQYLEVPINSIIVNLEQLDDNSYWTNETYLKLLREHEVWDYSEINKIYLKNKNIIENVKTFEVGYGKSLEYLDDEPNQDIDVLFIGSMNERRNKIYEQLTNSPELKNKNIVFKYGLFGDEKDNFLKRSKIVLNIHYYEAKILEVIRISHLLANKKCVISESSVEDDKNKIWGEGAIICDYSDIVNQVIYLLNNEETRKEQEQKGYIFIKNRPQILPILKERKKDSHVTIVWDGSEPFIYLVQFVQDLLLNFGYYVDIIIGINLDFSDKNTIYLFIPLLKYSNIIHNKPPFKYIAYQIEQPNSNWFNDEYKETLQHSTMLWNFYPITEDCIGVIKNHNNSIYVPFGHFDWKFKIDIPFKSIED